MMNFFEYSFLNTSKKTFNIKNCKVEEKQSKRANMQELIGNVIVDFPYKPYNLQKDYMRCVINSCENEEYALLESPTGTGKTLSLLCSVLSWKRHHQMEIQKTDQVSISKSLITENPLKAPQEQNTTNQALHQMPTTHIIYSSRTHSQLSNVINELKKTIFRPTVSQIASRTRLCLIEDIVKHGDSTSQSKKCRLLRRDKKCQFSDDERINEACDHLLEPLFDIEDFVSACKTMEACPYFVSQKLAERSDLVLMPYTYFVDPSVRVNLLSTLFQNCVLIVDEAHNFPEQCCDYFSFSMRIKIIEETANLILKITEPESFDFFKCHTNFEVKLLEKASNQLSCLFKSFSDLLTNDMNHKKYIRNKAEFWYEILRKCNINSFNIRSLITLLSSINDDNVSYGIDTGLFELLTKFFRIFFPFENENPDFINDNYGICLTSEGILNIFCFSPSIAFNYIIDLHPRTIILTSGTISPFESFASSLGFEFPIVLENPHIANPKNLYVAIASEGKSKIPFHFTYQNRQNIKMKEEFAYCLSEAMKITPYGFLTFFPSFVFLNEIESILKNSNRSEKVIIVEPRDQRFLKSSLNEFERKACTINGATLFAVCRGKMSEGLDFSDDFARCVCVVGIPFPNLSDVKIEMHKLWLEEKNKGDGSRWYIEKATRAVNQAIGRAIRHKDDYAAVILFDQRYEGFTGMISKWIRPSIKKFQSWSQIEADLKNFFEFHQNNKKESDDSQFENHGLLNKKSFLDDDEDDDFSSQNLNSSQLLFPIKNNEQDQNNSSSDNASFDSINNDSSLEKVNEKMVKFSPQPLVASNSSSPSSSHQSSQIIEGESEFQLAQAVPHSSQTISSSEDNNNINNNSNSNVDLVDNSKPCLVKNKKVFVNSNDDVVGGGNDSFDFLTRSQQNLVAPKISKSRIAAINLKNTLEKDDRKLLCDVLKLFKETRDIEVLRIGIDALESDECKKIIMKTMNSRLKEKFYKGE